MARLFIKEESIRRLRNLMDNNEDIDNMIQTTGYKSLYTHYMNRYEKDNVDLIISLIQDGYDNNKIIKLVKESSSMSKSTKKPQTKKSKIDELRKSEADEEFEKDTEAFFTLHDKGVKTAPIIDDTEDEASKEEVSVVDPVKTDSVKTETFFSISGQKVIEVEPIDVLIGSDNEPEKVEVSGSETHEVQSANDTVHESSVNSDTRPEPIVETKETFFSPTKGKIVEFKPCDDEPIKTENVEVSQQGNTSESIPEKAQPVEEQKKIPWIKTAWQIIKTPIGF